jgi:ubiquinone/menaquinone biosynthesis C-methylase UbiE
LRAFRFGWDPVCLAACAAYLLNRFALQDSIDAAFLRGTFDDVLLIPAALPWVLAIQRRLGWRTSAAYPSLGEIFGHLLVWSVVAEGIMPLVYKGCTADLRDVAAYAAGALVAGGLWRIEAAWPTGTGFDGLAPMYDYMEDVLAGRLMMRVRTAFLDLWPEEGDALLVGEGHGRFLGKLHRHRPRLRITYLDASAGMHAVARRRLQREGLPQDNILFVQANLRSWRPGLYDVISTQFVLDCFQGDELRALIEKLSHAARPSARWFLADFQIPPQGVARIRARIVVGLMYSFFRAVTDLSATGLEDPLPLLQQQGFRVECRKEWDLGLLYATCLVRARGARRING